MVLRRGCFLIPGFLGEGLTGAGGQLAVEVHGKILVQ